MNQNEPTVITSNSGQFTLTVRCKRNPSSLHQSLPSTCPFNYMSCIELNRVADNSLIYQADMYRYISPFFITKQGEEWAMIPSSHALVHCETGRMVQHRRNTSWDWIDMALSPNQKTWIIHEYLTGHGYGYLVFADFDTLESFMVESLIVDGNYNLRFEWTSDNTCVAWLGELWDRKYDLSDSLMMLRLKQPDGSYAAITDKNHCPLEYQNEIIHLCEDDDQEQEPRWKFDENDERYNSSVKDFSQALTGEIQERYQFKPLRKIIFTVAKDKPTWTEETSWDFPCQSWGWKAKSEL